MYKKCDFKWKNRLFHNNAVLTAMCKCCIINAALLSIRNIFKKHKNCTDPKLLNGIVYVCDIWSVSKKLDWVIRFFKN